MTWTSTIATELVITDRNYRQFVETNPRSLVDGQFGRGYIERDYSREPLGTYAEPYGSDSLIPRTEFYERAQELERKKRRLSDVAKRKGVAVKSQGRTYFCWINSPTFACELMRVMQGQEHVELSPASGGSKIKGFRNQGGWGDQACDWISKHGLVPESLWPANAISRQYDTDEAWTEADRFVLTEWHEMPSRNLDYLYTCLLRGIPVPVGYSWWRHLVCAVDVVVLKKPPARISDQALRDCFAIRIANSWGTGWGDQGYGILQGRKQVPDGQCAVNSMRLTTRRAA